MDETRPVTELKNCPTDKMDAEEQKQLIKFIVTNRLFDTDFIDAEQVDRDLIERALNEAAPLVERGFSVKHNFEEDYGADENPNP